QGIALHEALAAARVMTPEQLKVALKQQTAEVAVAAVGMETGTCRFEQKPIEAVSTFPDMRTSPVALVLEAAKRIGNAAKARAWLEQRHAEKLQRSPELEKEIFSLKANWPGESVTPLATGGRRNGEVLARIKESELALLPFLCMSGLLVMSGGPKSIASPGNPLAAEAAAAHQDRGKAVPA